MPGKSDAPTQFSKAARVSPSGVIVVGETGGQSSTNAPALHAAICVYWKGLKVGGISAGSLPSGPPVYRRGILSGVLGWPTLSVPPGLANLPRMAARAASWPAPGGTTVESEP